jgi:hypothetical protein
MVREGRRVPRTVKSAGRRTVSGGGVDAGAGWDALGG